jgi:amidohydrolase
VILGGVTDKDPKHRARQRVEDARGQLVELSHRIHDQPELGFEERLASRWLADSLAAEGFDVRLGVAGLETAFAASVGSGSLHVALLAEYDALPEIGHACGHNIIAATAAGAALALSGVADELGLRVTVLGTPAEEGGAGKVLLIDGGEFEGVHLALMTHPGPSDLLLPEVLAAQTLNVTYHGRTAHAAAFPELGVNAADALVVAQVALGQLRQALRPTDRVHGIVTTGGEAPNVIPALTRASWMIRAASVAELDDLRQRVQRCFEAGALASGARLEFEAQTVYADMRHDVQLAQLYARNAQALGRSFEGAQRVEFRRFSSDIGNVSYVVPAIHPIIGIESAPAVNHQPEFTAAAASAAGDQAIIDGAIALAWTAIDAARDGTLRQRLLDHRSNPSSRAGDRRDESNSG